MVHCECSYYLAVIESVLDRDRVYIGAVVAWKYRDRRYDDPLPPLHPTRARATLVVGTSGHRLCSDNSLDGVVWR